MIDFRYHLVSIVAVFLALAVGIVLGAGPLKDPVDVALGNQTEALREERNQLRAQVDALDDRVAYEESWASSASEELLPTRLTGQRVVVVRLPGADDAAADAMRGSVEVAGASVSGTVEVTSAWSEVDEQELTDLVERLERQTGTQPGDTDDVTQRAAQLLARALVTADAALVGVTSENAASILSGLSDLGVIAVEGSPEQRAGLAAVLVDEAPEDPDSAEAESIREALLPVVAALDGGQGAVVAGPDGSDGVGGLVRAVREDADLRSQLSTVDIVDASSGRTSAVVALAEQRAGRAGHYGSAEDADAAAPGFSGP